MTTHITAQNLERSAPVVSVIIPTHNRGKMLLRSVGSVLAQTWRGTMEIIVISDGSTDKTEEVVKSFNDPRIQFLKHENSRGASAARNTGLRECKGKYIAFLDDDDEWTVDKLEVQVPFFDKADSSVGLVYGWIEYLQDGKTLLKRCPTLKGNILEEMLDKQAITNSSALMIRREVIDVVKGFDENLPRGNDGDFIRRIAKYYSVDYVPKVLARVHVGHEDRISVDSGKNLKNAIFALEKRLKDFEKDFSKYPNQNANVLAKIGTTCFMTGQVRKGFSCFRRIMQSDGDVAHKAKLVFQTIKSILKFTVRKAFVSAVRMYGRRSHEPQECALRRTANYKKS